MTKAKQKAMLRDIYKHLESSAEYYRKRAEVCEPEKSLGRMKQQLRWAQFLRELEAGL